MDMNFKHPNSNESAAPYTPKIGEKCYIKFNRIDGVWYEYTIDFIGTKTVIASCKDDEERFAHLDDVSFKQRKTSEELDIKEAKDVVRSANNGVMCSAWDFPIRQLIKAGYHNQPKVKPVRLRGLS